MRRMDWMVWLGMVVLLVSTASADLYHQAKAPLKTGRISVPATLEMAEAGLTEGGIDTPSSVPGTTNSAQSPNEPPDVGRVYTLARDIQYPGLTFKAGGPLCYHNNRKVVAGSDEFFVAGWETGPESDNEVMATAWDIFFGLWSNPVPVSQSVGDAGRIDLAADVNGAIHAAWHQDHDMGGNAYEIFYSKLPSGAFAWTDPVLVSSLDAVESNFPTIAVDNAGNVTVRWSEFLRDAGGDILEYQGYRVITSTDWGDTWDPADMEWATEDTLLVWGSGCCDPVSGDIYLVDTEAETDQSDEYSDLVIHHYDKANDLWGNAEIVAYGGGLQDPFRSVTHTSCVAGPDGMIHILYAQTTNADPEYIWVDTQVGAPVAAELYHIYGASGNWSEPVAIHPGTDGFYEGFEGVFPDSTSMQFCSYAQIGVDAQNRLSVSTRAFEYYNGSYVTGYGDMYSDIGGSNFQPEAWIGSKDFARGTEWVWTRASDINLRPDSMGVKYTKLTEHVPTTGPAVVWDETYDGAMPEKVMFTRLTDFTSPGSVANLVAQRPVENGPITITWENPVDEDLAGIRIVRSTVGMASLVGLRRGSVPIDADGLFIYAEEDIWVVEPDTSTGEMDTEFYDENPPEGTVFYTFVPFDENLHHYYPIVEVDAVIEVPSLVVSGENADVFPRGLFLEAARPNPIVSDAEIRFSVPTDGQARIAVYDLSGRFVRTLLDGAVSVGSDVVHWDVRNEDGARVSNGVYLCRLEQEGRAATRNLVVLR